MASVLAIDPQDEINADNWHFQAVESFGGRSVATSVVSVLSMVALASACRYCVQRGCISI